MKFSSSSAQTRMGIIGVVHMCMSSSLTRSMYDGANGAKPRVPRQHESRRPARTEGHDSHDPSGVAGFAIAGLVLALVLSLPPLMLVLLLVGCGGIDRRRAGRTF